MRENFKLCLSNTYQISLDTHPSFLLNFRATDMDIGGFATV